MAAALNKHITVLVVEDSTKDFEIIQRAFQEEGKGLDLVNCTNGNDALDYLNQTGVFLQATKPLAILLDLGLPGMSGKEFLKIVKADPKLKELPVIVFTGSKSQDEIKECTSLGAISVFEKPLDYHGFMDFVKQIAKEIRSLA